MNSGAHVAITLLGLFLVVSGVGGLGSLPESLMILDRDSLGFVWAENLAARVALHVAAVFLFRIAPGLLLLKYRDRIVERVLPASGESAPAGRPGQLYVIGCLLLAVYFGITGSVGVVSYSVTLVATASGDFVFATALGPLVGSVAQLAAAALLYRHARSRGEPTESSPKPAGAAPRECTCDFCKHRFTSEEPAWDELVRKRRCPKCAQPLES